jgi:aryl-alcohol dehydrogenase-like predicted oxidoreductase
MDPTSRRPLGRTGLSVSPIGFGAFKIGRNEGIKYPEGYELPSDDRSQQILNGVLDLGINLIDTAPAYGSSEARIGRALRSRRSSFILSSKVGETWEDGKGRYDFSPEAVDASVDRSLRRLETDHIDIVFVHSDGADLDIVERSGTIEALDRRRDRGDIGFVGFSGKTIEGQRAAMNTNLVDVLMVEYHALDRSQAPVIEDASKLGIGVVIKKGLASGRIPAADAIPACLQPAGVATVVVGSLDLAHLADNLRIATSTS